MNNQEEILLEELKNVKKWGKIVSNREIYCIVNNHIKFKFKNQDECDNLIAKLISEDKFDKTRLREDSHLKFNGNLEKIMLK
jgi:hypothetical protein